MVLMISLSRPCLGKKIAEAFMDAAQKEGWQVHSFADGLHYVPGSAQKVFLNVGACASWRSALESLTCRLHPLALNGNYTEVGMGAEYTYHERLVDGPIPGTSELAENSTSDPYEPAFKVRPVLDQLIKEFLARLKPQET